MRMRQPGARPRDIPSQGQHLRVRPGAQPPPLAGRDPQVGNVFRNMRAATRLTREAIARRLATTPATIEDLENGAVGALPHWRETVRIVRGYCELLRLDPAPLLWRLEQLLRGGIGIGGGDDVPRTGGPLPALPARTHERRARERRGGGVGRILWLAAFPVMVAALGYLAIMAPAPIYKAISVLPDS